MRKLKSMLLALVVGLMCSFMTSCGGSGVDRSNPQAVAEKAIECYHSNDFEQLKTLVNPADTHLLSELDKTAEWAEKYKAEHPDAKVEPVEVTFKSMRDGLRGGDFTPATTTARVSFEGEKWPLTVEVVKVDDNWYFERFR